MIAVEKRRLGYLSPSIFCSLAIKAGAIILIIMNISMFK
jgi:hypothetical protein